MTMVFYLSFAAIYALGFAGFSYAAWEWRKDFNEWDACTIGIAAIQAFGCLLFIYLGVAP